MKTNPAWTDGDATNQPARSHSPTLPDHRRHWRSSFISTRAMLALLLLATGCKTFKYTEDDLDRERQRLADAYAKGEAWGGAGMGLGGVTFNPDFSNFACPGGIGNGCQVSAPGTGGGKK